MLKKLKMVIRRIVYPHSYNSAALVRHISERGGKIGTHTYIYAAHKHRIDLTNIRFIEIGDYCLITEGVIILGHDYSYIVPTNVYHDMCRKQRITKIGDNVFIGMNSVILMGAEIGDNVVIGAGSVVSGKVESNSVYAGNPARRICSMDEYHEKRRADFEQSALVYASKTSRLEDMLVYRSLFEDDGSFRRYLRTIKMDGLRDDVIENLVTPVTRLNWKEIPHKRMPTSVDDT